MPRPFKDVAAGCTLQIFLPTFKHESRPRKNRKKYWHCKCLRSTSFDAHSGPISPEVEAFKPGAPPSVDVTKRAGRHRPFSVISLISMYEWEYTLGQQQQVAPRSTPILHRTKNALEWGLCGILSKFGHARSLWLLGSSQFSKNPMQMCAQSGQ